MNMWVNDIQELAREGSFVAIDVEGDGNNPQSPVEIAAVEFAKGEVAAVRCWLVNPGLPMSEFVQGLHGITDDMLRDKPAFSEIEHEVRSLLEGRAVVAHGASEDLAMLRSVMPDVDFVPAAVLDTQRMARNLLPALDRYRLDSVREALGIDLPAPPDGRRWGFHSAENDAFAAGVAFLKLAELVVGPAKARRHASRMAHVVMSPQQQARRLDELAALGLAPRGPGR